MTYVDLDLRCSKAYFIVKAYYSVVTGNCTDSLLITSNTWRL